VKYIIDLKALLPCLGAGEFAAKRTTMVEKLSNKGRLLLVALMVHISATGDISRNIDYEEVRIAHGSLLHELCLPMCSEDETIECLDMLITYSLLATGVYGFRGAIDRKRVSTYEIIPHYKGRSLILVSVCINY
jgi:hypothetical protein